MPPAPCEMPRPPPPGAPPPSPPPREMPPPPSASASVSAMATRFATHWIADALAGDESYEFSLLQAVLGASSEPLAGAPEATRERVALRSLLEVSSLIPARGDAAATAGVLRVHGARSCEDVLSRLIREVEISGKLEKDLLPPFSQDIQETIRTKKNTLAETSFQLLNGVDPWITSMTPPSQLEHDASEPGHLPECITAQDTTVISQPDSRKAHSALQHERGEKVNQDLEDISASIRPVETDHAHGDLILQSASAFFSISCNGANQGSTSEANLQTATAATKDRMAFEKQNLDTSPLEVSGASKANRALHDDVSMMRNNTVHDGLTVQTAPVSQNCNVTLNDKTSEANCFSEQKNAQNRTDVQQDNCCTSIPSSSKDRDRESAKKTSNEEKSEDTSPEISVHQDISDTLEDLSQEDLCIRCGKNGDLLTCSDCLLAAHGSCFGSSATFEGTNLFYCPICSHKRARQAYLKEKKKYCEARKNAAAFLAKVQVSKQHDEQLNGAQPGAANRDGHSNGCDTSKRNSIHQNEVHDLVHQDEEPHQARKKQKINDRGNGYPEEVLAENVPFRNPSPASMNKHSVLQNNSKTRVEDPEKKQQAGDKETHKEAGDDSSSSDKRRASSQKCDPSSNQDGEADQEDSLAASNQTDGSDEIEATSSNGPGKQSSPPWRNLRHGKKGLHEEESGLPSISRKGTAKQGRHVPQKRYSNRVAPNVRRDRLDWTEAEESGLRDAMAKFAPQVGEQIPWTRILEYGSHVFHKTRLPSDLRTKWRNMQKKAYAGNLAD